MTPMRIIIEAVPSDKMRLPAYRKSGMGDWFWEGGDLHIQVAGDNVWDDRQAFLIALHELIEARLCADADVSQRTVDAFDEAHDHAGEPGDAGDAPYRVQHRQAMLIEHLMALFLGITDYGTVE